MNPEEILKLNKLLMDELLAGGSFHGLARQLSGILEFPVIITDLNDRVLGAANSLAILEGNLLLHCELDPNVSQCILMLAEEQQLAVYWRITGGNSRLAGFLYILTEDAGVLEIAQQAAPFCALELMKQNYVIQAQREYKDAFIYDLLYSNIESVRDIMSRGEIWGWDLNRSYGVIVFELEDYQDFSADSHLLEGIYARVEAILQQELANPIIMKLKGQIIAILPGDMEQRTVDNAKELAAEIQKSVRERSGTRALHVGVGRVYESVKDIFRSFQEAKIALELGRLMEIQGGISFFSDLGLARILYNHDRQELKEFYWETLGALEGFDLEQGNTLMATLEQYFQNQCDLKVTANDLFLHPNTLRYRLKRIEEVLQVSLEDFETRLNLMTAFKAKYLKKI